LVGLSALYHWVPYRKDLDKEIFNFRKEVIFMATKQKKYEALKTAIEIAKEYARSAAEGYPTGVMKDSYKAIIAIIDEIENSDD